MSTVQNVMQRAQAHSRTIYRDIVVEPLNKGMKMRFVSNYFRWHLGHKYRGRRWLVHFDNGMKSWVYPFPDHNAGQINIWTRNVDFHDTQLIRSVLDTGDFIVDAGCNIGNRTWALADMISGALMIDAGEKAIERTSENLRLNGLDAANYVLVNQAVGETEGQVLFTDLGGASPLNHVATEAAPPEGVRSVRMTTIDCELERLNRKAAFIKVDVEGQDFAALKGASRALASGSVKLVKFEHHQTEPLVPIVEFFAAMGWVVYALDQRGNPSDDPTLFAKNMNLFASPQDQLSRLGGVRHAEIA